MNRKEFLLMFTPILETAKTNDVAQEQTIALEKKTRALRKLRELNWYSENHPLMVLLQRDA